MMRAMRRSLLSALLFFFSVPAFAQQPAPDQKPAPPTTPTIPTAPTIDDPMLQPPPRAKTEISNWEEALKHVRARSTDLRIAMQEIERAEGQSRVALAGILPTINGNVAYTHNIITNETVQFIRTSDPANPFTTRPVRTPFPDFLTAQAQIIQPVIAPRAWYAIGTADRAIDISKIGVDEQKRLIAVAVANAMVGVVLAERVAELNRLGLKNALTRLELSTRRAALGGGTGLDVVRARQDVENARAILVTGDEALRQQREALGLALGLPEQVGVPPTVDLNGLEADARKACKPAPNVDERPDVALLRGRAELAHRAHNDVKYQFSPTVDIRSAMNTTTIDTGAAPNTTWNIQAVLTVPLWEGGARYGLLRTTTAEEIQAQERHEAARRTATIQVTQAQRAVTVAEERRRVAASARDLATENDRLTRAAYVEGRGTSLELVDAARTLRQTEIELAQRDFELVRARVAAVLALATCPW
jgi:outer membrane protein TolC